MTNLEGRVIRRKRAVAAPIGVASDIGVLVGLAERLGKRRHFAYGTPEDVFNELARATRGAPADYSGITYAKIDAQRGVFWPCPSAEHTGHAAAVPRRLRDAVRQGALPRRQAQAAGRDARQGLPALPDHRPRARPVPVGHDDPPRAGAERDVGHAPSPSCTRRRRRG